MIDLERIVPLKPDGTATPVYCVHASSGSAYSYLGLASLLGDRPVYGIEAPGFDGDREPVHSLPLLSAEYVETLRAFQPEGDFVLLGWSLGGLVAFDMAQRLAEAGRPPRQLIMIDVSTQWEVVQVPPEREIAGRFLHDMLATVGAPTSAVQTILAALPEDADGAAVFTEAERCGALPEELDADLLGDGYPVFRAHMEAMCDYVITGSYAGPVVHLITAESLMEYMRWENVMPNLTEHIVPGGHYSIWSGDSLRYVSELVRSALAEAD